MSFCPFHFSSLRKRCDLVSEQSAAATRAQLQRINSAATVLETQFSKTDLRQLLNIHAFDAAHWQENLLLRQESVLYKHTEQICSVRITLHEQLDKEKFRSFLADLLWEKTDDTYDVLRLKGLLTFGGKKKRYALQGVRETWQLEKTRLANQGEPSELVFIGRSLQLDDWRRRLQSCQIEK